MIGGIKHKNAGSITTGPMYLRTIIWSGFTDTAHLLTIKDGNGELLIEGMVATGSTTTGGGPIVIPVGGWVDGIETDTIGSGQVNYIIG